MRPLSFLIWSGRMLNWKNWSSESLDEAFREGKPLFVRLDSEACRYSQMMQEETYSQKEVARFIAESFVPIHIRMEERPDLSLLYSELAQWAIGEAGSPIHLFLTPDLEAFFVGGYFPLEPRYGLPGFSELLKRLDSLWREKDPRLFSQAKEATNHLAQWRLGPQEDSPRLSMEGLVELAEKNLLALWDPERGGFGKSPRFFYFDAVRFLWKRAKTEEAKEKVLNHIFCLAHGGVFDARSGHLFRHSLDEAYRVPKPEMSLEESILFIELLAELLEERKEPGVEWILRRHLQAIEDFKQPSGFYACRIVNLPGLESFLVPQEEANRLKEKYPSLAWDFSSEGLNEGFFLFRLSEWPKSEAALKEWQQACEAESHGLRFQAGETARLDWNAELALAMAKAAAVLKSSSLEKEALRLAEALSSPLDGGGAVRHVLGGSSTLGGDPAETAKSSDALKHYVNLSDRAALGRLCLYWENRQSESLWKKRAEILGAQIAEEHWDEEKRVFFFDSKNQSEILMNFVDRQDRSLPSGSALAFEFLDALQKKFPSAAIAKILSLAEEKLRAQAEKEVGGFTRFALVMAGKID